MKRRDNNFNKNCIFRMAIDDSFRLEYLTKTKGKSKSEIIREAVKNMYFEELNRNC